MKQAPAAWLGDSPIYLPTIKDGVGRFTKHIALTQDPIYTALEPG
jgi:hypothetical protein